MITTIDNPYSPLEDYQKWRIWDRNAGYFTEERIARLTEVSLDTPSSMIESLIEAAEHYLIENDPLDVYVFVEDDEKVGKYIPNLDIKPQIQDEEDE